jgi:hypothetical protein
MRVPKELRVEAGAQARMVDVDRQAAYRDLFPPLDYLHISDGRMALDGGTIAGESEMRFTFFAMGVGRLRFLTSQGKRHLVDAIVYDGTLTAMAYWRGEMYLGEVTPETSPLTKGLGWDPADIYVALTVGEAIGKTAMARDASAVGWTVRPEGGEGANGLAWVRLDPASGLPSAGGWARHGRSWTAKYGAWAYYAAPEGAEEAAPAEAGRLMPQRVTLHDEGSGASVELEIREYRLEGPVSGAIFTLGTPYRPKTPPLEALEGALK